MRQAPKRSLNDQWWHRREEYCRMNERQMKKHTYTLWEYRKLTGIKLEGRPGSCVQIVSWGNEYEE